MRGVIVKGKRSKLHGAPCGLCPHPARSGQSVLYRHMPNGDYAEPRLVFHVDCMAALVDRAPKGLPAGDARATAQAIRRAARTSGDPFARPAA